MKVNLHIVLKIHPAVDRCKLGVSPTVARFLVSQFDDVCLFV
jgi:hypothetical protein